MKTYLDTSALVKLVVAEDESTALQEYLRAVAADTLFTAALARTELIRAVSGAGAGAVSQARRILDQLDTINLTRGLLDAAADLRPARLRTLDAIHLAAAQRAGTDLRAVVTYDTRMAAAAADLGIVIEAPA
ncbi:PIN domain protein [Mycobacterium parascrofulaceum ATCC BAA-614]|uniref:Ribonuclease VapC n=1 Tax=Mycobacterium parascrofulaceum ATCC BAA-614 TaxID=525368 RepID=D5P7G0_9MYCO|nr:MULTISPECIES: type II toxin-antitoxin system VapC family toxin [Mycobacterium]EFG77975.1 PIN domain protein [Mycobacterium parascrofulaceum ATCC BAA-614]OCB28184.1 nucleic acid-binding protein [Mycobacterium malmoense]